MSFRIHTCGVLISPRLAFQTNGNRKANEHDFQALQMKVMNLCKNLFTKVKDFVYDPLRV